MASDDKLKTVMASVLGLRAEDINDDTTTDTVGSWDSVHHLNLVLALEESFGITVPDDEVVSLTSYKLIKLVIDEQLAQK